MIDDQARALLIVGALLFGAGNTSGFVGGRMTAPVAEPELRFVHVPVPAISLPAAAPIDPPPAATAEPEPAATPADAEPKPLPRPRPKAEVKPKPKPEPPARKPRKAMPSCAFVKQRYEAMSWPERMAAYKSASPEQVAHGKRCLGF